MTIAPSLDPRHSRLRPETNGIAAKGRNEQSARIRDWLRQATDAMLEMAEVRPDARVLDIAAGAGEQTLDIAERVGPGGLVLATDLSPLILEFAKDNARRAGYGNVETQVADGESLDRGKPVSTPRFAGLA